MIAISLCVIFPQITSLIVYHPIRIYGIRLSLRGTHWRGTGRVWEWQLCPRGTLMPSEGTELLLHCYGDTTLLETLGFRMFLFCLKYVFQRCLSSLKCTGYDRKHMNLIIVVRRNK